MQKIFHLHLLLEGTIFLAPFTLLITFLLYHSFQVFNVEDVHLLQSGPIVTDEETEVIDVGKMELHFVDKVIEILSERQRGGYEDGNAEDLAFFIGLRRIETSVIKGVQPTLQQVYKISLPLLQTDNHLEISINLTYPFLLEEFLHFTFIYMLIQYIPKRAVISQAHSPIETSKVIVEVFYIIYTTTIMMSLVRKGLGWFGSTVRRQNFFELNPIYPDQGQKDFDIYNVEYKHIQGGKLAISDEQRYQKLKQKITQEIYLRPIHQRSYDAKKGDYELDEETGFPLGIHEDFDNFIEIFKRQKKVGDDVIGEFEELTMTLMRKFEAKSEIELIKIFRFNLANLRKEGLKDKLRGLLINSAFMRFIRERKAAGNINSSLSFSDLQHFLDTNQAPLKRQGHQITKEELQETAFRGILKEFDDKIAKIEEELHRKALADRTFVPFYHPKYGPAIKEEYNQNLDYDLNFSRGFANQITSTIQGYTPQEAQDRFIQNRVNQLFFMRALEQVQKKQQVSVNQAIDTYDLPLNIRHKDKIINSLLYKYKEEDLLVEPDLEDIYAEIDIALKKVTVKVVPNFVSNQQENQLEQDGGPAAQGSPVKERIVGKDVLIWSQLDVEEIFDPDHYDEDDVNSVKVAEKELLELSPAANLELSLNKVPMNLYRHADLDNFGVFNKYRKRIYKDYITDRTINPEVQFKFFSLEEAQTTLSKVKKPSETPDRFYGYGKRKSSEAEVYLTKGTGKVIINNQPLADYCGDVYHRGEALKPLIFTQTAGQFDLEFTVVGGGIHSQAECMAIALTNALISVNPKFKSLLEKTGLVGIDDRKKEAKKIGLYSARVRPPFVRR